MNDLTSERIDNSWVKGMALGMQFFINSLHTCTSRADALGKNMGVIHCK